MPGGKHQCPEDAIFFFFIKLSSMHSPPTFREDSYKARAESKSHLEKTMYKEGQEDFEKEQGKGVFLLAIRMDSRIYSHLYEMSSFRRDHSEGGSGTRLLSTQELGISISGEKPPTTDLEKMRLDPSTNINYRRIKMSK